MAGGRLPDSDDVLVARVAHGDSAAFDELVHRHEERMFALALRMTGNRADALDAVQETFLTLWQRAASFRGASQFGTWLYRIGVNSCHDLLRRRERRSAEELIEAPDDPRGGSLEEGVARRLDLDAALAGVPEDYRQAVVLHDLLGVPYEEIARITGVATGTVKSRISRGRRRLAELLEHPGSLAASKETTTDD